MKNPLDGLVSGLDMAQERNSELEDLAREYPKTEKQREQRLKKQQNIQGLWDNGKRYNICIMGLSEGKERDKRIEEISGTMTEDFPK